MPFTITCDNCGYQVAGEDEETGTNFGKMMERMPGIIYCEMCNGNPVLGSMSKEQYDDLFKELKVKEGTIIFVTVAPNWKKVVTRE